jgi:galactose-1-phosphate uridylyltransferase
MNVGGFASSIGSNEDLTIDKNSIISKDEFQTTSLRSPIILKGTPKN